jgi:hypothetical protein
MTMAQFWGSFVDAAGVPISAFQDGYAAVQDDKRFVPPPFPYITYPMLRPGYLQSTIATAAIWDRRPTQPGFFGLINHVLGQVEERVPHEGIALRLDDDSGLVWLQRGSPFFIFPPSGDSDMLVVRGVINLVVRGYVL